MSRLCWCTYKGVADGRVQFIDGNHFFPLGAPDATTRAMREFLSQPNVATVGEVRQV